MQNYWTNIESYLLPGLIIFSSMVIGFICEKILYTVIKKKTKVHPKESINFSLKTLRMAMIILFFIVGVYASLNFLPLKDSVISILKQVSLVILIYAVTVIIVNIIIGLINTRARKSGGAQGSSSIITNLIKALFYIIGFTIILQTLGISITPILTALGIGGVAVALALQDTLSNFFAGLYIVASGQVKVGDFIRLDNGQEGYVTDIKWRDTTIRALSSNMIIVPNTKLSSNIITNFYQPQQELGVSIDMIVRLDSDLNKVEQVCVEVARDVMNSVSGGVAASEPSVGFSSFVDNGIKFSVNFRVKEYTNQYLIKHEFIKRILPRFKQEGIHIPYPIREVVMKGGNLTL